MMAAYFRHKEIVQELIQAGAAVNARDQKKQTALLVARLADRKDIIKMLFDAGAKQDFLYDYYDSCGNLVSLIWDVSK